MKKICARTAHLIPSHSAFRGVKNNGMKQKRFLTSLYKRYVDVVITRAIQMKNISNRSFKVLAMKECLWLFCLMCNMVKNYAVKARSCKIIFTSCFSCSLRAVGEGKERERMKKKIDFFSEKRILFGI
jgi:hypothetical protein